MKRLTGYEVKSLTKADGIIEFFNEGAALYMPETDVEIGLAMVKVSYMDEETIYFRPMSFTVRKLPASPLQEEKEIPEEDR